MTHQNFINSHLGDLAHQNYKYIEIVVGTPNSDQEKKGGSNGDSSVSIFNTKLEKEGYDKILAYFAEKMRNFEPNIISNKIYCYDNLQLTINETFQPRCFKKLTLRHETSVYKKLKLLLNFSEKKMIPINRFENKFNYDSEVLKKTVSYNIKKKFFLNFSTVQDTLGEYNTISFMITKKNGKSAEITKLLEMYLNVIEELL
tara:strand:+ start:742 stop:1344 length:603 start_codon:yes stop_codon:yes gene_type:complete